MSVAKKPAKKAAKKVSKKAEKKPAKNGVKKDATALSPGDRAPAFSALDDQGRRVSLKQFVGKPVVLYFYPKDDTPGCTKEACDFRDSWSRVQSAGAVVLGVSKDSVERHAKFKAKYGLPHALIADVDGKLCEAYGAWQEKSLYGRKFMGIVRSTFVIGPDGRIARVFPKVKVEGHVDEVLASLKG